MVSADEPSEPYILASRSFVIPFTVDSTAGQRANVELLVADMQGVMPDQWQSSGAAGTGNVQWLAAAMGSTDHPEPFSYTAAKDGEFWFTTRTVRPGQAPPAINQLPAGDVLKVLVDTTPPVIEIVADADGDGTIRTDVVIRDATRFEVDVRYVTDIDKEQWKLVPYHPSGSMKFQPKGRWGEAAVVVTALDAAGNKHSVREYVRCPRVALVPIQRYAALPQRGYDARPAPYRAGPAAGDSQPSARIAQPPSGNPKPPSGNPKPPARNPKPPARTIAARTGIELPPPATPEEIGLGSATLDSRVSKPAVAPEAIGLGLSATDRYPQIPLPPSSLPSDLTSPEASQRETRPSSIADRLKPIDAPSAVPMETDQPEREVESVRAGRSELDASKPTPARSKPPRPALPHVESGRADADGVRLNSTDTDRTDLDQSKVSRSNRISADDLETMMQRVPVRYSNSHRFSLDYEVEALGSRGVDAIELFGTVDRGQTWSLWGKDADRETPFDIEVRDDGVFGFRIVVVGQSGLNSPRPLSGEEPDILVVVDRDKPDVRITGAKYGVGDEIGSLVIEYDCEDGNLKKRPITLAFAESVDGPWTTIAGGLLNNGRYAWPADPDLPRAFYLRVDATDASGNVGTHILDRPIDAQGLAPRARIRGFRSL